MRISIALFAATAAGAALAAQAPPEPSPVVKDASHFSQVMGRQQGYQVILPPAYASTQKRYPVVYWFHGFEQSSGRRQSELAAYVAAHDVIVVDVGPVEANRQFALYFPELMDQVDKTLRTVADRDHRAVTGVGVGGFTAYWIAGKYPDLVSSASSFNMPPELFAGPRGFNVELCHDDLFDNYDGVRTLLATGPGDPLQFYHGRMNALWMAARTGHEAPELEAGANQPSVAGTLDFHMRAFANPLPKPAVFNHADVYPNFEVWGWDVVSNRRQPGFTALESVSITGFRSAVREWLPGGALIPEVKLSITSPRSYVPGSIHPVVYIRIRDGKVRHTEQKADAQGRLTFDLDGDAYEVGVSAWPVIGLLGYEIVDADWATAGKPVNLRLKFCNKGSTRSGTKEIRWEGVAGVKFAAPSARLYGLAPGETATLPVTLAVDDPRSPLLKFFAVDGANRIPVEVPLYPPAAPTTDFWIADGREENAYQHATERSQVRFGEGNGDGHAAPGETFAVLLPDTGVLRAAELFTNDPCVGVGLRASDSWPDGASVKYTLASVRGECDPGHVVHMLARVVIPALPAPQVRYWAIEFPIWWRNGEEPK